MKVVWICHFSNSEIRKRLTFPKMFIKRLVRKILRKPNPLFFDYAQWITNGIKEFESKSEVELHIISPHWGLSKKIEEYNENGIHYHFFRSEEDVSFSLAKEIFHKLFTKKNDLYYKKNRQIISNFLTNIKPDIIHLFGAENPYYSLAALDIDVNKIPLIVSLQTLMSEPCFKKNYPISQSSYDYRSRIEQQIIKHAHYLGSTVESFRKIIWNEINPNILFFNTLLFVGEKPDYTEYDKKYDFVYFAVDISKSVDLALEAFAIVHQSYPDTNLCIIGGCNDHSYQNYIDKSISELEIKNQVLFTGKLSTHDDVLNEVKKSRFALLPLKVDLISSTIREAMSVGVPVISTITPMTPKLNATRQSILLSKIGDSQAMANQMISLLENNDLANHIRKNAYITISENYSNKHYAQIQLSVYQSLFAYHKSGRPLPKELYTSNPKLIHG